MRICGASLAKRRWIASRCESICSFGAALERPKPYYDVKRAMVMCYVVATYGPGAYPLGTVPVEFTDRIRDNRKSRLLSLTRRRINNKPTREYCTYCD